MLYEAIQEDELWMMDRNGGNKHLLLQEPQHIIAYPRWSPGGEAIAYIRMMDSNVPFSVGELCLADGLGANQRCIAPADAGHGYPPVWSPDGKRVAFVVRRNPDDQRANNEKDQLLSNIYLADPQTNQFYPLTQFENALTDGLVWSPNGLQIAFRRVENGQANIWIVDIADGKLQQVTFDGYVSYPVWLSLESTEPVSPDPTEER
jgi:Tol biopolymer transport system component